MIGSLSGALLATSVLALVPAGIPSSAPSSSAADGAGVEQKLGTQVPLELGFADESGTKVELAQYFGGERPVILVFAYYDCPMLCTLVMNGLVRALRPLSLDAGRDYQVVVVSIDPRDTPAKATKEKASYLRSYARPGTESGWHFLTGQEPEIRRLAEATGFRYALDPASQQYAHPAQITVLTPGGKVSRYFDGVEFSSKDLRLGLVDASAQKIGTLIDRVLLLCFHYDPTRGKYGVVVMNVLRIAGAITVAGVLALMFGLSRRRRALLGRSA